MIGKKFNRLTVIEEIEPYRNRRSTRRRFKCICDCGNEQIATGTKLRNGKTYQCRNCGYRSRKQSQTRISGIERHFNLHIINRSKKRNIEVELTIDDYETIISQNCHYCNIEPQFKQIRKNIITEDDYIYANGIDRIDSSKGYNIDNCVPCCKICNTMKHTLNYNEFIEHINKIKNNVDKTEN